MTCPRPLNENYHRRYWRGEKNKEFNYKINAENIGGIFWWREELE
jgi:hypothetical protein